MKSRMYEIKKEMKILKERTSREIMEMKKEERMTTLRNERDWFRREALGKYSISLTINNNYLELDKM